MPSIARGVNSVALTNVGKLYASVPDVTISPPDIDSDITLSFTLDSDRILQAISIVDSGAYYKVDPVVTFNYRGPISNYILESKFGEYSYKISSDDLNRSYGSSLTSSGDGGFFIKCQADVPLNQSLIRFVDSDSTNAKVEFRINGSGNAEFSVGSNTLDTSVALNDDSWHWVWFEVVNNILYASVDESSPKSVTDNKNVNLTGSMVTIINNTNSGSLIDDLHINSLADSSINPTFSIPTVTQDSNETTLILDNYEGPFNFTRSVVLTTTADSKFRLSSVQFPSQIDTIIDSASFSVSSPTGTKSEFTAKAYAVWDSSTGTITSLVLTDSGDYYSFAPNLTISDPLNVDYPKNLTVTQTNDDYTMSGEVVKYVDSSGKLFLAHIGANDGLYHTFQTNVNITGSTNGAVRKVLSVSELTEEQEQAGTVQSQNYDFDTIGDSFLDFTESNPFGDPQ